METQASPGLQNLSEPTRTVSLYWKQGFTVYTVLGPITASNMAKYSLLKCEQAILKTT